jgi:hypothetical protein
MFSDIMKKMICEKNRCYIIIISYSFSYVIKVIIMPKTWKYEMIII